MESMGSRGGAGRAFKIERMGCLPKRRCCLSVRCMSECGVLAREGAQTREGSTDGVDGFKGRCGASFQD